jgi:hypothetical protein
MVEVFLIFLVRQFRLFQIHLFPECLLKLEVLQIVQHLRIYPPVFMLHMVMDLAVLEEVQAPVQMDRMERMVGAAAVVVEVVHLEMVLLLVMVEKVETGIV